MASVFISHVEEDQHLALEIAAGLEAAGFETWYYERDSEPGLSYLIQVHDAIERCVAVVLLISPNSIKSHQMTKEVVRANDLGKPFVPVRYKISHAVFQEEQPEWNIAIGAAASIPIPEKGVSEILPRIVRGLEALTSTREDDDREERRVDRMSTDDDWMREATGPPATWIDRLGPFMKRHRLPVAGSAAAVVILMYLAQMPPPSVQPQTGPPAEATLAADAAPPAVQPTAAPAVTNVPSGTTAIDLAPSENRGGSEGASPAAANAAASPVAGTASPIRRTPAIQPAGTQTVRRTPAASPAASPVVPEIAAQPVANNAAVETPRRTAADDSGAVRLPASPVNAPAIGTPALAPAPANAAVIPRTPTAATLVSQTIAAYAKAAEALDVAEVRRVWPGAPSALDASYRNLRSQSVDLNCGEPAITGDTATVSCRERVRSVGAGGITLPAVSNTARFVLRRNGGTWQIASISRGN